MSQPASSMWAAAPSARPWILYLTGLLICHAIPSGPQARMRCTGTTTLPFGSLNAVSTKSRWRTYAVPVCILSNRAQTSPCSPLVLLPNDLADSPLPQGLRGLPDGGRLTLAIYATSARVARWRCSRASSVTQYTSLFGLVPCAYRRRHRRRHHNTLELRLRGCAPARANGAQLALHGRVVVHSDGVARTRCPASRSEGTCTTLRPNCSVHPPALNGVVECVGLMTGVMRLNSLIRWHAVRASRV